MNSGVSNNNFGVKLLEKGKLAEALQYFQRALRAFPTNRDFCIATAWNEERIINWSDRARCYVHKEDEMYIFHRGAIILPSTESMGNPSILHEIITYFNIGLTYHLGRNTNAALLNYQRAHNLVQVLQRYEESVAVSMATLDLGLVNNMACLLGQERLDAQAASQCFQYMRRKITCFTPDRLATLFCTNDSDAILLNTMFDSYTALAA